MTRESAFAARTAYALSALLILLPLADITLGFFPLQFDNLRWRIGVTGMTTGALLLPITGFFLALTTAHFREDRGIQTGLSILLLVGGLLLFAAAAMFTLDTLQMRGEIDARGRHLYDRAAIKGIISQVMTASALLFVSISSLRTSRSITRQSRHRPEPKTGPIMGRSDAAAGANTVD
ncbi:MAG TPA: hypothetical protein VGC44_05810 [Longimicrobiales bacterium]